MYHADLSETKEQEQKGRDDLSKRSIWGTENRRTDSPIVVSVELSRWYVKEGSNWYLRAYIDKPGGIAVDDCEVVSRAFSEILDREDYIEDTYIFEVSSPGLGRPLKKKERF